MGRQALIAQSWLANRLRGFVPLAVGTLLMAPWPTLATAAEEGAAPAAEDSAPLAEVVVTVRRRDESLSKVPESVAVLSQKDLTQHAIANVYDLNKAVPGLTVQSNNGSTANPAFSIRGRGQNYGAAAG